MSNFERATWAATDQCAAIRAFYEGEYLNYFPTDYLFPDFATCLGGLVRPHVLGAYKRIWDLRKSPGSELAQWVVIEHATATLEENEAFIRQQLCEQLIGRARYMSPMAGVPKKWWEDHPALQTWWNPTFPRWPDGVYTG